MSELHTLPPSVFIDHAVYDDCVTLSVRSPQEDAFVALGSSDTLFDKIYVCTGNPYCTNISFKMPEETNVGLIALVVSASNARVRARASLNVDTADRRFRKLPFLIPVERTSRGVPVARLDQVWEPDKAFEARVSLKGISARIDKRLFKTWSSPRMRHVTQYIASPEELCRFFIGREGSYEVLIENARRILFAQARRHMAQHVDAVPDFSGQHEHVPEGAIKNESQVQELQSELALSQEIIASLRAQNEVLQLENRASQARLMDAQEVLSHAHFMWNPKALIGNTERYCVLFHPVNNEVAGRISADFVKPHCSKLAGV